MDATTEVVNPSRNLISIAGTPSPPLLLEHERLFKAPRARGAFQDRVVLFRNGRWTVVNFGLFAAIGVLLTTWYCAGRLVQVAGPKTTVAVQALLLTGVLGVVGTRLLALALDWRVLLRNPMDAFRKAGFAFQGAVLLVLPTMYLYMRHTGVEPWVLLDSLALSLPLGHAIGRIGCFTYGCCHGRPTQSRWAIRYSNPLSKAVWDSRLQHVPLHPAQLYEAAVLLGIFVFLNLLASTPLPAGTITGAYLASYGLLRAGLEYFRGEPGSRLFGLTQYQGISLGLFALGLVLVMLSAGRASIGWSLADLGSCLHVAAARYWLLCVANGVLFLLSYGVQGRTVGRW